jgi:hypothetical protein
LPWFCITSKPKLPEQAALAAHWRCKTRATLFAYGLDRLLVANSEADEGIGEVWWIKDFEVCIK